MRTRDNEGYICPHGMVGVANYAETKIKCPSPLVLFILTWYPVLTSFNMWSILRCLCFTPEWLQFRNSNSFCGATNSEEKVQDMGSFIYRNVVTFLQYEDDEVEWLRKPFLC